MAAAEDSLSRKTTPADACFLPDCTSPALPTPPSALRLPAERGSSPDGKPSRPCSLTLIFRAPGCRGTESSSATASRSSGPDSERRRFRPGAGTASAVAEGWPASLAKRLRECGAEPGSSFRTWTFILRPLEERTPSDSGAGTLWAPTVEGKSSGAGVAGVLGPLRVVASGPEPRGAPFADERVFFDLPARLLAFHSRAQNHAAVHTYAVC